jgi:hypothetical protein
MIMKITPACSAVLFCFLLMVQSCNKKSGDNFKASAQPDMVVNAGVAAGEAYIFIAGSSGTLSVTRQASHYQVSETGIDNDNGSVIYKYKPAVGYTGSDEVLLAYVIAVGSNGTCPANPNSTGNTSTRMIVLKLNVTN